MFEITADDIALLGDEDLRSLVARLCESDLARRGISPSCVTWGGDQDARDGGIDVRVALPEHVDGEGFIPRPETGFQVKAEDTPASKIFSEMRPKDALRPAIRELAERSGAYIMVSSKGSVSDAPLQDRREAMSGAVGDLPCGGQLKLDFYDRRRLETWLRDHLGTTLWARERIGKPIQGWQSYGNWSQVPAGADTGYLQDSEPRVRTDTQKTERGLTALAGIDLVRNRLRQPGGVVRLVGLSGLGKTRFAQALFDKTVGENSLDADLAAYTDVAKSPDPEPNAVASELIATRRGGILVIDNCRPELHRQLADACRSADSPLSLVTIEADVQDDIPEGTDVFALGNASIDLTEKLTRQRFPKLSPIDSRRVADYSGGNARIALALASTIEKTDSTATLSDVELLRRLFQQRHPSDPPLLAAAEALSLVYSFDGEDVSETGELSQIGGMIGKTAQEMFGSAAELRRRDLVQARSKWRAVLPQGIANKLATLALENIPRSVIESRLVRSGSQHLLRSFSRRLSFLDTNQQAQRIVRGWLDPNGLLGGFPQLNDLGHAVFENIAPVVPDATLAALERVLLKAPGPEVIAMCERYLRLLRSLAYDPALFERCMGLIVKIVESTGSGDERDEGTRLVASLFPIRFSGTHASVQRRLAVADSLLASDVAKKRALGLVALRSLLEATHFGPGWEFDFGTRPRDYGYAPANRSEVENWFALALQLAEKHACSGGPVAEGVRDVLAGQFRGLWSGVAMHDDLERVFRAISDRAFWREGWLAVRQTMRFDLKGLGEESAARLTALEAALRPQKLIDHVRAVVLSESVTFSGLDSEDDKNPDDVAYTMSRVASRAEDLGRAVGADADTFEKLLPELVTGGGQLWSFGRGMAQSIADPKAAWGSVVNQLDATPPAARRADVLGGFLNFLKESNPPLANSLLDEAVENDSLALWYPWFQAQSGFDESGVQRLMRSLATGKTPTAGYVNLVAGHAIRQIHGKELKAILLALSEKDRGLEAAIQILYMRIVSDGQGTARNPDLIEAGRTLMARLEFGGSSGQEDYRLPVLVRYCLKGDGAAETVRKICTRLGEAIASYKTHAFYHEALIGALFAQQPLAALRGLCSGIERAGVSIEKGLSDLAHQRANPLGHISTEELLLWCDEDPSNRYPAAANVVPILGESPATGGPGWSKAALSLLNKAPDKLEVLKRLVERFRPWVWAGSRSAIIESNAKLLDQLNTCGDPALATAIAAAKTGLAAIVQSERDLESYIFGGEHQSFE